MTLKQLIARIIVGVVATIAVSMLLLCLASLIGWLGLVVMVAAISLFVAFIWAVENV